MKQPRGSAGGDFLFFIFFLIVLGVVWALTGGPDRDISREGPFLNPPFPLGSGGAYTVPGVPIPGGGNNGGGSGSNDNDEESRSFFEIISGWRGGTVKGDSPHASSITFSRGNTGTTAAGSEYLVIKTARNMSGQVAISAWRVESPTTRAGATLGNASYLPFSGSQNPENAVMIGADTTVYVVTGRAPTGYSFRANMCTGYFNESQDFTPSLRNECPQAEDELTRMRQSGFSPNDACIDYVEDISRCELALNFPSTVDGQCQNFVTNTLTYNGCVNAHKSDTNFYKNVWYLYLDRDQELWKSRNERIALMDENGKIISLVSY